MFWFCWCYPQLEIGCQELHHSFHVTPIRPKFVLAVLWLHHNCCSHKLYGLKKEHPARTAPSPAHSLVFTQPIGCRQGKDINIALLIGWLRLRLVRLYWTRLLIHSSVGLAPYINAAGNFRKITFSRPDWTMVIMSDPKSLLKYPHTSSRQSKRRTNKRKRVSWRPSFARTSSHEWSVVVFKEWQDFFK